MKLSSASKLTLKFSGYFAIFYLILLLIVMVSIGYLLFNINHVTSDNIHSLLPNDFEGLVQDDQLPKSLTELAEENFGVLYLFDEQLNILDQTSTSCELCSFSTTQLFELERQGMQKWHQDNYVFLFVPNYPTDHILREALSVWQPLRPIPQAFEQTLKQQNMALEVYNAEWQRVQTSNDTLKAVTQGAVLDERNDPYEYKELLQSEQVHNYTVVIRMKNPNYNPFYAPFNEIMWIFIALLIGGNVLMLIAVPFVSGLVARQFVRPITYIMSRIERLSHLNYARMQDKKIHHKKTGKLKRQYRTFEPVEQSLNNLAERLAFHERQLQRNDALKEEWITGVSHDLKTPLSSIYGYSTMLTQKDYDWTKEDVADFAAIMQEKAQYMDALIQDLTYTYQLKNRAVTIDKQWLSMEQMLLMYKKEPFCVQVAPGCQVYADEVALKRIIDNIASNAEKYSPPHKMVGISAVTEHQNTVITVVDEGSGMSQEVLDNLFTRYYRGTNTTDNTAGTGLGLAITKQLVDLHNGTIEVMSGTQGTTVTITLPQIA